MNEKNNITKTAMLTVCGRPNVGKSSLTNALVGEKIAIVSSKPQTTRNRIYGVVNRGDTQFILLDTPGLHKARSRLGDYMVKVVRESLASVEAALLLVEPIPHVGEPEKILLQRIREEKLPCVLCINKIDTVEPAELLPVIAAYNEVWDGFDAIIPISAHKGGGLDDLMHELQKYAQEGPQLFPDGETTDQPERQVMGELLREKHAGKLAFVGDAVSDASVISKADVGVAIGALNPRAAASRSDILIMSDDIRKLPLAMRICKAASRTVRLSLLLAIVVKLAVLLLAALGSIGMIAAVTADTLTFMLTVVGAYRIYKVK